MTEAATALALVPDPPTLDEALDTLADLIVTDEQRENFALADEGAAQWAGRRLRALHEKIAAHNATADAEIARVNAWREQVLKQPLDDVEFFEGKLRFYHETLVRNELNTNDLQRVDGAAWKKAKSKSQTLIGGVKLGARKPADEWTFDSAVFIPFADEHLKDLELVRRKPAPAPEVDINAAKAALTVTKDFTVVGPGGLVVEGVEVKPAVPTFGVKIVGE